MGCLRVMRCRCASAPWCTRYPLREKSSWAVGIISPLTNNTLGFMQGLLVVASLDAAQQKRVDSPFHHLSPL